VAEFLHRPGITIGPKFLIEFKLLFNYHGHRQWELEIMVQVLIDHYLKRARSYYYFIIIYY
jgi:hypothetical protein